MYEFRKCVDRYNGNYHTSSFSCLDQYLCMAFAQLTYRESLRDIEACLRSRKEKLYHLGIRGRVSRSTLAEANEKRDWRMYADFCQILISQARSLYADEDFGIELKETAYALDSTTIDLCLSIFPWASFRKHKAAVKMHTLLDLRGSIPSFIEITKGTLHDVNILDIMVPEPGSFYIMDRGYLDFERLYVLTQLLAFFVTRAKKNNKFRRIYSHPVDRANGLRYDQTIMLVTPKSLAGYPEKLRRVKYFDAEREKQLVFLTNNFVLPALTIAKLYKCRWQIELFFKWIKQHLRIKAFYGTSINAVKTQIWIAVSTYVLVAIIRKRLQLELNLYTILQILSVTLFEKVPLDQLFANYDYKNLPELKEPLCNQLNLFDY
ncbi:MAG: transposase [Syntrophobacterales bacterium RBG_19FT_COMBO_59_10]|nr:MAG: transposase [Syntrophobacterales bacterium RBG_19FT_COMBO_59_10]